MDVFAIRGATTIESDRAEEITANTTELMAELIKSNRIDGKNVRCVSVAISSTTDIESFFPARAVRESKLLEGVPLFSCTEPKIKGSLPLCIRVMLTLSVKDEKNFEPQHVYFRGAALLRPDLVKK